MAKIIWSKLEKTHPIFTEEYETFVDFYKYRCCGHCGQYVYDEGAAAVEELNGAMLKGREARVNEARPRDDRR